MLYQDLYFARNFPTNYGLMCRIKAKNFKVDYQAIITQEYDQRFREREIRYLQRKAAKLGFTLSPLTNPVLAVS